MKPGTAHDARLIFACGVAFAVLAGCPGQTIEGGGSETDDATSGATDATDDASGTTHHGGTTDADPSATSDDDGTTTQPVDESTGADGTEESTGGDACAGLSRDECTASEDCEPIRCSEFEMQNQAATPWCLGEPVYLGCRSADADCEEGRVIVCAPDDGPVYACRDDCTPADFDECDPPVMGTIPPCE